MQDAEGYEDGGISIDIVCARTESNRTMNCIKRA